MLTITNLDSTTVNTFLPNLMDLYRSKLGIRLFKKSDLSDIVVETPPHTGRRRHPTGERSCVHLNLRGNIFFKNTSDLDTSDLTVLAEDKTTAIVYPYSQVGLLKYLNCILGDSWTITYPDMTWVSYHTYKITDFLLSWSSTSKKGTCLCTYTSWIYSSTTGELISKKKEVSTVLIEIGKESGATSAATVSVKGFANPNPVVTPMTLYWRQCGDASRVLDVESIKTHCGSALGVTNSQLELDLISRVALEAVQDCHVLDLNSLAFGRDLRNIKELAGAVASFAKIRNVKGVANAYLGNKYGTLPFISDSIDLVHKMTTKAARRMGRRSYTSRSRSQEPFSALQGPLRGIVGQVDVNVKLTYAAFDNATKKIVAALYDYDVFPSLQNLWDFIPYSFVCDWFVDVGGYLDARDAENYLHNVDVRASVVTIKRQIEVDSSLLNPNLSGHFTAIYYNRDVSPSLPPMPLSLELSLKSFHNWWEAAALIVQRKK